MNLIENLVQTATEESAELAVAFSKANRFSLQSIDPKTEKPSHETIVSKLNDVLAVIELLRDRGVVLVGVGDPTAIGEAKKKFVEHMEISQKAGTLVLAETDNDPKPPTVVGGTNDPDAGLPDGTGDADTGTDPDDLTNSGEEEEEEEDDTGTDESEDSNDNEEEEESEEEEEEEEDQ